MNLAEASDKIEKTAKQGEKTNIEKGLGKNEGREVDILVPVHNSFPNCACF